jgi:hypothetical protein
MDNDKENDSDSANELVASDTRAAVKKKLPVHDAKPAAARGNRRVRPLQRLWKTAWLFDSGGLMTQEGSRLRCERVRQRASGCV